MSLRRFGRRELLIAGAGLVSCGSLNLLSQAAADRDVVVKVDWRSFEDRTSAMGPRRVVGDLLCHAKSVTVLDAVPANIALAIRSGVFFTGVEDFNVKMRIDDFTFRRLETTEPIDIITEIADADRLILLVPERRTADGTVLPIGRSLVNCSQQYLQWSFVDVQKLSQQCMNTLRPHMIMVERSTTLRGNGIHVNPEQMSDSHMSLSSAISTVSPEMT